MWFKNNIDRHEYPKQLQAHPAKKVKYPIPEIPDDSGKKSGTDWVLPKIIGSGRVSGTRQALLSAKDPKIRIPWSSDSAKFRLRIRKAPRQ